MNRIDRLLGMLLLLQSRKYVPAEQLAEKYGISVRTVYRDIRALGEQGVPVSFEPNRGYYIVRDYFLPPVSFTTEEANAFLLMETIVSGFSDKGVSAHYHAAMNKVRAVLRPSQKEALEQLQQNIRLQIPKDLVNEQENLVVLQQAIARSTVLRIAYTSNKAEATEREVEPIGLIYYALNWHLIGWCYLRNSYRDFKVARITKAVCTSEPFRKTGHMTINDYMKLLPVSY